MARTQNFKSVTLPQGADLTEAVNELVKVDANGRIIKTSVAADVAVGVIVESASRSTVGDGVAIGLIGGGGIMKVKAAAAITRGHLLVCHATDGKASGVANIGALAVDQMAFGIALEAAAAADVIISFLAMPIAAPHSV